MAFWNATSKERRSIGVQTDVYLTNSSWFIKVYISKLSELNMVLSHVGVRFLAIGLVNSMLCPFTKEARAVHRIPSVELGENKAKEVASS